MAPAAQSTTLLSKPSAASVARKGPGCIASPTREACVHQCIGWIVARHPFCCPAALPVVLVRPTLQFPTGHGICSPPFSHQVQEVLRDQFAVS